MMRWRLKTAIPYFYFSYQSRAVCAGGPPLASFGVLSHFPLANRAKKWYNNSNPNCVQPCRAGMGESISTEKRSITMAHFVTDECVACGACVDTCPVGAISLEDKAVVDAASCVDCGACEGVCPTGAIKAE